MRFVICRDQPQQQVSSPVVAGYRPTGAESSGCNRRAYTA
jgi:hypothetical protein